MYKFISYAYPTSTTAKKFGFEKTGCYTVEKWNQISKSKVIKAFLTLDEAVKFAETVKLPKCTILWKHLPN